MRASSEGSAGFGVYVHWPFCASKCPYCDFNSHVRAGGIDEARYLRAYLREIEASAAETGPAGARPVVESIFFGGGTPSLMSPSTTGAILEAIGRAWSVASAAEVTIEANPGSVDASRFAGYRAAGVNRVSLGIQSLRDADLKSLGRRHDVAEARRAIAVAAATFERMSFDLIYARVGQTVAAWREELAEALTIAGSHLSLYQLTIEPETPFAALHAAGKLPVPDGETSLTLYEATQEVMERHGLPAYEVSNHAAPGEECRHNLLYWRYGTYAGIGPGAHGRLMRGPGRIATVGERNPERWLARVVEAGLGWTEATALTPEEQADECLLMGMRLTEGIDLARLADLAGLAADRRQLEALARHGLITIDSGRDARASLIRATSAGRLVLNRVIPAISETLAPIAAATTHKGTARP
ncbi:MAG TPA: radical SAM family heme chaperone HemW [Hyphomicrobiaceae bacterium]|nr:radical SAM family heme chaperone HemW [Hyphomicrobiaceae bacterium]